MPRTKKIADNIRAFFIPFTSFWKIGTIKEPDEKKIYRWNECFSQVGQKQVKRKEQTAVCARKQSKVYIYLYISQDENLFDNECIQYTLYQKHITPKRTTLSQCSGFLGNQSKFTS